MMHGLMNIELSGYLTQRCGARCRKKNVVFVSTEMQNYTCDVSYVRRSLGQRIWIKSWGSYISLLHPKFTCFVISPGADKQWFRQHRTPADSCVHFAGISRSEWRAI